MTFSYRSVEVFGDFNAVAVQRCLTLCLTTTGLQESMNEIYFLFIETIVLSKSNIWLKTLHVLNYITEERKVKSLIKLYSSCVVLFTSASAEIQDLIQGHIQTKRLLQSYVTAIVSANGSERY